MSSCTAAEIAAKKRAAQEKLRAKQAQLTTVPKPTSYPRPVVAQVSAKPAANFYKPSAVSTNKSSDFLQSVIRNKKNDARSSTHPYQRQTTLFPTSPKSVIKAALAETADLAPVFCNSVKCECSILSDDRFDVTTTEYHSKLVEVFKSMPTKSYDPSTRNWSFSMSDYNLLLDKVNAMKPNVLISGIPRHIIELCKKPQEEFNYSCLSSLEPTLCTKLLPFQKDGVCFGISKQGRVLIADEMGLGKTYQALAMADFYRDDWPLLICTTATTRDSWATHIRELLPYVACHHIVCLTTNQQYFGDAKVLITSYTMLASCEEKLLDRNFGIIIMDESHTLKNSKAKCTAVGDRLAQQARRVILLSGTPALSRPVELFSQLQMLDRKFFRFMDYTTRYCDGKQTQYGWVATGQSNLKELEVVLRKKYMIRRVKANVLPELAEKFRQTVILDPELLWNSVTLEETLSGYADELSRSRGRERETILLRFYAETASVKARAVCSYLRKVVKENIKFIVFAHHKVLMDAISKCMADLKLDYIRIDGSTRNDLRSELVDRFQKKSSCKVAVLSLRACNAGITLTAAKLVVFAELDWNPSTLAQAESRAHRIGQKDSITCRYLIANKTADDVIWNMLKTKQDILNKAGLFSEDLQDAEHTVAPPSSQSITNYFTKDKTPSPTAVSEANATKDVSQHEYEDLLNDDDDEEFSNLNF